MGSRNCPNPIYIKLPLLKQGEYNMWKLRIEQYFQVQDYALWDVIKNGNSFKPTATTITNVDGTSTTLIPGPVTADEKTQKKNDVKASEDFSFAEHKRLALCAPFLKTVERLTIMESASDTTGIDKSTGVCVSTGHKLGLLCKGIRGTWIQD
ncbi:hypothetical protein Tco_0769777 [Tanacetum coccineum]|uniref:Uncharacterized protein n=1 Tax=Tanacetum coccineum TaxID=301880 RepID=A0ABQ4ZBL2_9ASTR